MSKGNCQSCCKIIESGDLVYLKGADAWDKLPSVTREGRWFYFRKVGSIQYLLLQDWSSGRWFLHIRP